MDTLPKDLLLHILGFLDDGLVLLDAVPRVCKRWCWLSRDPRAWAGVVVSVGCCREGESCDYDEDDDGDAREQMKRADHRAIAAAARVLLRAPFLRKLEIGWSDPDNAHFQPLACAVEKRVIVSALRRCSADIHELVLPEPDEAGAGSHWGGNPLARFAAFEENLLVDVIAKSRRSLRALKLGKLLASKKVVFIVSLLTQLQTLHLVLSRKFKSTGPLLRGALPNLRRLEVSSFFNLKECPAAAGLVADLVLGAPHLRELHFCGGCAPLPPSVAAKVRRCRELRALRCDVEDVVVLRKLPQLRALDLSLYRSADHEHGSAVDIAAFASATVALDLCGPLASLRHLRVDLFGGAVVWPGLESLLKSLASAASEVTSLVLAYHDLPVGGLFLERMPRLRAVKLYDCSPGTLASLAKLPALEKLAVYWGLPELDKKASEDLTVGDALVRLQCLRSLQVSGRCPQDGLPLLAKLPKLKKLSAAVECRATRRTDCLCEAAIADFKRLRPGVEARLTLGPHLAFLFAALGFGV